jgi:hypothetical protein
MSKQLLLLAVLHAMQQGYDVFLPLLLLLLPAGVPSCLAWLYKRRQCYATGFTCVEHAACTA